MFEKRKAAKARAQRDTELVQFTRTLADDQGVVSESDEARFVQYVAEHGYTDASGAPSAVPIPSVAIASLQLGLANRGKFVECDSSLLLKPGEVAYCEVVGRLLKEVADREFQGGSRGVSIPLGHGVRGPKRRFHRFTLHPESTKPPQTRGFRVP